MVQNSLNPQITPASESEVGYGQLFAVFVRRFPWFLAVLITSIALAGVVTFKTKPTYKSSMQLLIEPNYQGKTEGAGLDNQFTDSNVVIDTATQLNLMQSSGLIQKAVEKLQSDYPDISSTEIKASLVLTQLRSKEDNVATKIFQVEYTAGDPESR